LTEPLELVYKADGKKSEFWPADLNSLIAYSPDILKKLLGDYQLPVDKEHRTNLNRFMGHIGTPFTIPGDYEVNERYKQASRNG
ncbi:hypothetical protein BDP27DRAFT_1251568, partial [Rhodocollybia butyracea]